MKIARKISEAPRFLAGAFMASIAQNRSVLARVLHRRIYRTTCFIDTQVVITVAANFRAAEKSALYHGCYILNPHGQFELGKGSHLGAFCYANVCHGKISIGDNVAIGPGTKLFSYSNHYRGERLVTEERITADVHIGNNVFIGANSVILPGSKIADNVIVGAGSLVRGELAEDSIYAGTPCRIIRRGWYRPDFDAEQAAIHGGN